MIKIEPLRKENGVISIVITSNDPVQDRDKLDLLGAAILSEGSKLAGFKSDSVLEINVLDPNV